jgi:hypothetical protein
MMIAQFLQRETNSLEAIPIPNASLVWQRAASRSRAEALARATRPIQWVVHASVAVTFAATLWLIFDLAGSLSSLAGAVSAAGQHVGGTWIYASIITGAVTMLGIVAGAMYMLSVDKERARFVKTY